MVASGEEKLTLQFSLSSELENLVANTPTGMESKEFGETFSAFVIFTTGLLIKETNDSSIKMEPIFQEGLVRLIPLSCPCLL